MSEQPMPTPGGEPVTPTARTWFHHLLTEREQRGIATYGQSLTTDNGRDALLDAAEEAVDLFQYLTQARMERMALERRLGVLEAAGNGLARVLAERTYDCPDCGAAQEFNDRHIDTCPVGNAQAAWLKARDGGST